MVDGSEWIQALARPALGGAGHASENKRGLARGGGGALMPPGRLYKGLSP